MSFKVAGKTSLVVEANIIEQVAKKYGWSVEYNAEIRSHDIAVGQKFDIVLRNPAKEGRVYDVGITYSEDGKTAEFIYDRWGDSVENQLGAQCGKFKNECAVAAIHENDTEYGHLDYEEYFEQFCQWDDDGSLIYNGYDDEPWQEEELTNG